MKQVSLSELSLELGVNKSKLMYYAKLGLLKPIDIVGRMQIFDYQEAKKALRMILRNQVGGKKLKEIIAKMK